MIDLPPLPTVFGEKRRNELAAILAGFVDPRLAAVRLARALEDETTHPWAERTLFSGDQPLPFLTSLCSVLERSEFLTSILERNPDLLTSFESDEDFSHSTGRDIFREELHRHLAALGPGKLFRDGLARFKLHEIFRIAVRDITDRATIEVLARELSDVADLILEAAYDWVYAETIKSLGVPLLPDGEPAQMTILSMGKHGSRELNFSSDLDLIFVFEGEGETNLDRRADIHTAWLESHPFAAYLVDSELKARTRPVDFEKFFTDLGTRLIEMLSEVGPLGAVYRIDMRLRPDGPSGPLAREVQGTLEYYETWGENWERQALLRVRPSGGCPRLGERFMRGIAPFIHRKYVDEVEVRETLSEMRSLRARSISQAGTDIGEISRNVKNGPGGIRDVEFMVQAVQLLYGGQYPEFREGTLFEILRRIHQSGLLGERDFTVLSEGYNLLRRIEHRIQMDDLQRYHLPPPGPALEGLACSLGFESGAAMEEKLFAEMRAIHRLFQGVFRTDEEEDDAGRLIDSEELSSYWRRRLEDFGFRRPEPFFKSLKRLAEDPNAPHLNSKLRRLLKGLLPRLLKFLKDSPNPEEGWRTFERICDSTPARPTFFSVLTENPAALRALVRLSAASPELADRVVASPQLLNDLRSLDVGVEASKFEAMEDLYHDLEDRSIEGMLPRLRRFRMRLEIDVAGSFALGSRPIDESVALNSRLAEYCLLRVGQETFGPEEDILVLALGKFGGRELGFRSDLDCILIRPDDAPNSSEYYARAVSRLVREMNATPAEGRLYELDLRLRPLGKDGPLAPTLSEAADYYRTACQTWERLALTRCRPLTGSSGLAAEFDRMVLAPILAAGLTEDSFDEIHEMRLRIQREKPKQTLKAGPGGLLDVEFIAQTATLLAGPEGAVRSPNTLAALSEASRCGILAPTQVQELSSGYLLLREIENRLYLMGKEGAIGIPEDEETLDWLVGCMNLPLGKNSPPPLWTTESLTEKERETRRRNREIFEELFVNRFRNR